MIPAKIKILSNVVKITLKSLTGQLILNVVALNHFRVSNIQFYLYFINH